MKKFELGNSKKSILGLEVKENNYDYNHSKYVYDENRVNDAHTSVIKQISENSTVLDIGCASGILGYVLNKYKHCEVDGIEYDKKAFEVAKKYGFYNDVMNFSITDVDSDEYKKFIKSNKKYDYIVFADVLEHLVNPYDAIYNVSKLLKKNGKIIVSVPNICHIDIIKGLFEGTFNYSRFGILDSTHLRFFSIESFYQMINNINTTRNINLKVDLVDQVEIKPEYFDDLELFKLGLDDKYLNQLLVLQNVFTVSIADKKCVNKYNKKDFIDFNNFVSNLVKKSESDSEIIRELQNELHVANEQKDIYEMKVNRIHNSMIWKISKPFRYIKNKLFRKDN